MAPSFFLLLRNLIKKGGSSCTIIYNKTDQILEGKVDEMPSKIMTTEQTI
jgi:hypothetical protein